MKTIKHLLLEPSNTMTRTKALYMNLLSNILVKHIDLEETIISNVVTYNKEK